MTKCYCECGRDAVKDYAYADKTYNICNECYEFMTKVLTKCLYPEN